MSDNFIDTYRFWLEWNQEAEYNQDKKFARDSLIDMVQSSVAYQKNAKRNGITQPMIATRSDTRKCSVTVLPGDSMFVGDLIFVFNEYWICVELYTDEYDLTYGVLWLCNHEFKYQDKNGTIIRKKVILDDGTYSKNNDKAIPVINYSFVCYASMDEESRPLCIDKRLAIDVIFNSNGDEILDVGKINWLDTKSHNFGAGSHLMVFGLADDLFKPETDSVTLQICDYNPIVNDSELEVERQLTIAGRDKIRIGTGRTYKAYAYDSATRENDEIVSIIWEVNDLSDDVVLTPNEDNSATITVALKDDLIGNTISLVCIDSSGKYEPAKKEIEVVSIG